MCRDHRCLIACEGGGPCDVSLPVKNNTDRMTKLVRYLFLPGWSPHYEGSRTDVGTTDVS